MSVSTQEENCEVLQKKIKFDRIQKRFMEKFPSMDFSFDAEKGEFINTTTQMCYVSFESGYKSHPNYGTGYKFIIGKLTENGLEVSNEPSSHRRMDKAKEERKRLSEKYPDAGTFVIFETHDTDFHNWLNEILEKRRVERLNKTL